VRSRAHVSRETTRLRSLTSRFHCARRAGVARVERGRAADVQAVPPHAAEGQIGDGLRHVDLAEQLTFGTVAENAIVLRVRPTH
jgi:hypothetical protein